MSRKDALLVCVVFLMGLYFVLSNVLPKYEYIDDQTPDLLRFNKINGSLEVYKDGGHWHKVVSKSIARVDRPTISYEDFMQGRANFEGLLKKADELKRKGQ